MKQHQILPYFALLLSLLLSACFKETVKEQVSMPPLDAEIVVSSVEVKPFLGQYGRRLSDTVEGYLARENFVNVTDQDAEAELEGNVQIGHINIKTWTTSKQVEKENKNGKKYETTEYTYHVRKTLTSNVSYTLNKNGRVIAGNSFSENYDQEWNADSTENARAKADSDDQIIALHIDNFANNIIVSCCPHEVTWDFDLQEGGLFGSKLLKAGVRYYKEGLYSQAEDYWKRVISTSKTNKDQAAAYYNLGVLEMRNRRYAEAFNYFREADLLQPGNSTYMDALNRVEQAGQGERKLRQMHSERQRGDLATPPNTYHLTISATPSNARIRFLNIPPDYEPGIALKPGKYQIAVDLPGYHTHTRWLEITNQDMYIDVSLVRR